MTKGPSSMTQRSFGGRWAKTVSVITICLGFLGAIAFWNLQRGTLQQTTLLIRPPEKIERLTFGYNEALADLLWIRVLQNFDSCGRDGRAEDRDYKKGVNLTQLPVCNNSWVFQMIDAITNLSPRFFAAYYFGGLNLSYLVNDIEGAEKIYAKGLVAFPNDLRLLFSAAYHMLENVKDKPRAAHLMLQAAQAGAPTYFMEVAARLFDSGGRKKFAIRQLEKFLEEVPPEDKFRAKLEARLKQLRDGDK
jgi:hypothetical protein